MTNHRITPLPLLLLSFVLMLACKSAAKKDTPTSSIKIKPTTEMPTPLPLTGDYADDWKIVDSLERQGLFKSALERSEAIQAKATRDKNSPQVIKALLYRGKYVTQLEEDGFVKAVQLFEKEEKTSALPEKAVLQSILGQLYATYLNNQGWRINDRTPIPDGEGGDILTWSAAQIEKRAIELYSASVAPEGILKDTPVESFRDVLSPGQGDMVNGQPLRPTLFDLLAHRALEHFSNERSWLTEPAYAFSLNQPEAFAKAADFVKTKFESKDSTSGKWLAVNLYQKVLAAHAIPTGGDAAAHIDADLSRLRFAKNNSTLENKDALYLNALEILHKTHYNHPSDAEIVFHIAQHRYGLEADKGQNAQTAVTELEDAIRRHPNNHGTQLCQNLLDQIRATSLSITVENVYLPEKPALVQVQLRNVSKVFTKVVRANFDQNFLNNVPYDRILERLQSLPQVQARDWDIPLPADYQPHTTEIYLSSMPLGHYYLLAAENRDFDPKKGHVAYTAFTVSNLAAVTFREENQPNFIMAHRQSGTPLAGVKLDFFAPEYQRRQGQGPLQSIVTNQNGLAKGRLPDSQYANVRASLGNDTLWLGQHYSYRSYYEAPPRLYAHFFTDRAIYRPGQTVYFKGVLFKRNDAQLPQITPNQSVTVKFYDVNHQEKAVLQLRSNEFGTFNGAFTAPATGLTGQMHISCENAEGTTYFSVEEYKRPKFEVTFKPIETAFRLGETVTARGEAKAYAGSNVDGAQVRYRVVRQARFPFWDWGWGRRIFPPWRTDQMEIANGTTTTDAEGKFEVKFPLIPDADIPKKDRPMFDYTVYADVTDITGETRSSEQIVTASYVALQVNWGLRNEVELSSLDSISLETKNLAGQPQDAKGTIAFQPLRHPGKFFAERYWQNPDLATIPKDEWTRLFPDFAWKDEDAPTKWEREDFIVPFEFNTAAANKVNLRKNLNAGWYIATLTTQDAFGEKIEIEKIVRVWDKNNRATQFEKPSATAEKTTNEPGETARIWLGGKTDNLNIFFAREQNGLLQNPRWLSVNGATSVEIPVLDTDRGGISAHWCAVKNNRLYGGQSLYIAVPWSNKDLNISFETFRDKLAPGQQEEWRIKISGPKKEKVAAEMVAAMYDASLDQFLPHEWNTINYPTQYPRVNFSASQAFGSHNGNVRNEATRKDARPVRRYQALNWFGFPLWGGRDRIMKLAARADGVEFNMAAPAPGGAREEAAQDMMMEAEVATGKAETIIQDKATAPQAPDGMGGGEPAPAPPTPIRRNLNETVFFFPEMRTDAAGNVVLKFTMNEALTRWKLLTYAHTKDLQQAISVKEVVTQKELMVLANPPRFLRAGDEIEFSAKVSNLSQETLNGKATLSLLDANTLQPLESVFGMTSSSREANFTTPAGQSSPLSWKIKVPEDFTGAVTWQIFADSKNFKDGEESTVPVVTNRMLVTETLPITVRGNQTKEFVFENLKNAPSGSNSSLVTQKYTLEFTSNPAWYAVQALPYLMEFPHECSEQIFSRFYANTLASSVTEKMPNIRRIYDRWKGTDALKSNLSKNQELKYALLEETPWVLDAQNEEQQKQNIALLFDLNRMADERERAINTLAERQYPNGGWAWFPGGRDSWHITQHIVSGFGHLKQLGAFNAEKDPVAAGMLDRAISYCDAKLAEQYRELERLVQEGKAKWDDDHLDGMAIHYLYARSFFQPQPDPQQGGAKPGREHSYYLSQAEKYWLKKGLYQEGMLALALHRSGRPDAAQRIVASLRERALVKEELGMFWPVDWGYYWYQLPVETQALMVEVFDEVAQDRKAVEELRIWLLKNKQTNRWESTKATAEAVYALLLHGDNWLQNTKPVQVSLGGKTLKPNEYEPGTGYFKQNWGRAEVKNSWSNIKVENPNPNIVWGAAYWQYFEDLDKIKDFQKTPLTIVKQLFKEENSPTGPVLKPVAEGQTLKRGDKIKVRIEIRVDRAMEYVHLKDMRAAGFEPVNVLSGYRWQDGLGYYESTKDLATHFFIDYLPRGTFVFEYPLFVSHKGDMSNGVTTMQCMYAPEFTSHSKGVRVRVE
ncbi:MAG: alpha-2-macroglobulin [Saprospiraceae bacterium]|nr:alpha-2-macroglobulin [Saprospiraceae bacterium]